MTYEKLDQPEALAFIFHPQKIEKSPLPLNATDIDIEVEENVILGCRFYGSALDAPTIIFFHGNGEVVSDYDEIASSYTAHGMNFFVTTYRGYGWSTGRPTVSTMYTDAAQLLDKAIAWLCEHNYTAPLFVMGRSLGSAPAIEITKDNEERVKGLIIESGFADTLPLARNIGIDVDSAGLTEDDCFNNRKKIGEVTRPTIILHGAKDSLIPPAQAENLQSFCGARSKQFHIIPGAEHNTMIVTGGDLYFQTIKGFIDTLTGATSWRAKRKEFKNKMGSK